MRSPRRFRVDRSATLPQSRSSLKMGGDPLQMPLYGAETVVNQSQSTEIVANRAFLGNADTAMQLNCLSTNELGRHPDLHLGER